MGCESRRSVRFPVVRSGSSGAGAGVDLAQLPKRIEALAALAREMKAHHKASGGQPGSALDSNGKAVSGGLSPESCDNICATLSKYLEAVNKVQTSLQRDLVHLDIVEKHSKDSDASKQYSVLY